MAPGLTRFGVAPGSGLTRFGVAPGSGLTRFGVASGSIGPVGIDAFGAESQDGWGD